MKFILSLVLFLCSGLIPATVAFAEDAEVIIRSPAEGAKVDGMEPCAIEYDVMPGPRGDHVHLYVDGKETAVLRQLSGSYSVASLDQGQRELCIKVVNKNHTPIGVEKCVTVTVE